MIKMSHQIICSLIFLTTLSLTGGCLAKNEYTKIESAEDIITIEGLSLLPPDGNGWYFNKKNPTYLLLGKLGNNEDQSVVGSAILSKLPEVKSKEEFLALISEQRSRKPFPSRFELISNTETISKERDNFCIRFHTIHNDYESKNLPETEEFLVVEDIGLVCRHPYDKKIAVTIVLSQRTKQNNRIINFESIANDFIENTEFIPFSKTNLEQGISFFQKKKYTKAIDYFNQVLAENHNDYRAYFYRGFCYFDQKKYSLAISDWEKSISLKKDFIEAYANLASIYLEMKDYKKALFYINTAIEYANHLTTAQQLQRESPTLYEMRVKINYEHKNFEQIINDYRYLTSINSKKWYVYNNLVSTIIEHSKKINKSECIAFLNKSEELAPNKYQSYINDTYGELFFKLGENDKSLEYYNKAFNQSTDPTHKKKIKTKISQLKLLQASP